MEMEIRRRKQGFLTLLILQCLKIQFQHISNTEKNPTWHKKIPKMCWEE